MHFTTFSDYSLRVLVYLAPRGEQRSTCREIAHAYSVSDNHLRKVVHHLVRHGYIDATRGRHGGLKLHCPPAAINIGAIVRESEARFERARLRCTRTSGPLGESLKRIDATLGAAVAALFAALQCHTLADLFATRPKLVAELAAATTLAATKVH